MSVIAGRLVNGTILLSGAPAWPEGTEVLVTPRIDSVGMTEDEQGDDPESIERWIAEMEAIPPLVMDPEDEARMWAALNEYKEFNKTAMRRQMEENQLCPDE